MLDPPPRQLPAVAVDQIRALGRATSRHEGVAFTASVAALLGRMTGERRWRAAPRGLSTDRKDPIALYVDPSATLYRALSRVGETRSLGDALSEWELALEPVKDADDGWYDQQFPLVLTASGQNLSVHAAPTDDGSPDLATLVVRHLGTFLAPAAAGVAIGHLPVLDDAELERVLGHALGPAVPYPSHESIPALFLAQARAAPQRLAVVDDQEALSYAELDARSSKLGTLLRLRGVGRGARVGVLSDRSIDSIVAFLAVLKAGAAYVPLDPTHPDVRLSEIATLAGIDSWLLQPRHSHRVPGGQHVVPIDAAHGTAEPLRPVELDAAAVAYVMFTSGSTGVPKGVEIPHRAVVRLVFGQDYARFGPDEVFLQLAPTSFDASTFEIWGALLHSGCVIVPPPGELSLAQIERTIRAHGVTTVWLTAGLFERVVEHRLSMLRSVRQVLTGGDVVSPLAMRRLLSELPGLNVVNGYGPTESTTFACCHRVTAEDVDVRRRRVPIGRPIANTSAFVLSPERQLLPTGVVGELYIGGDGLALGYVGRRDPTSERFLDHDVGDGVRRHLYRTGDWARYRDDGVLDFIGRRDTQVKIRGHRIEVEDLEGVLGTHPGVGRAVVAVRGESAANRQLVAHILPSAQARRPPTAAELRSFLVERVPSYLLPAAFVTVDRVPLTSNGKVDRRVFQTQSEARPASAGKADEGPLQSMLEIWRDVLGQASIGPDDDFFDLGGDSLLAVVLFASIEDRMGVELPLALLHHFRTPAELTGAVRIGPRPTSTLVPVRTGGSQRPLFCVHGLSGDVFNFFGLADRLGPDQPLFGLRGLGAPDGLPCTVQELAGWHVAAVRAVHPRGPYALAGYSAGGTIAFEMARRLAADCEEIVPLIMLDADAPASGRPSATGASPPTDATELGTDRELVDAAFDELATNASRYAARREHFMLAMCVALSSYAPGPYDGPITVIRALDRRSNGRSDGSLGWSRLTTGQVIEVGVPGPHLGILKKPYVSEVARQVEKAMARCPSRHAGPASLAPDEGGFKSN